MMLYYIPMISHEYSQRWLQRSPLIPSKRPRYIFEFLDCAGIAHPSQVKLVAPG